MNLYNFDLLPVLLALIVIASVVLWVAIRNYKNFILMFFLIPLTLYSGWTIYTTVDKLLGYPVIDVFEKDTLYLSHFENPDIAEWVYVWVLKPGESKPKAIMIPATEENKDKLAEAEQKSSEGVPMYMEMKDGQGQTAGGELNVYDFQQNWGDAAKEEQRRRDQEIREERLPPGPAPRPHPYSPPHHGGMQLQIDDAEDQYGGNDQLKIWRDEEDDDLVNPFDYDWQGDDDSFSQPTP